MNFNELASMAYDEPERAWRVLSEVIESSLGVKFNFCVVGDDPTKKTRAFHSLLANGIDALRGVELACHLLDDLGRSEEEIVSRLEYWVGDVCHRLGFTGPTGSLKMFCRQAAIWVFDRYRTAKENDETVDWVNTLI